MAYDCPEGLNESDDKILTLPERTKAIRGVIKELEAFTNVQGGGRRTWTI